MERSHASHLEPHTHTLIKSGGDASVLHQSRWKEGLIRCVWVGLLFFVASVSQRTVLAVQPDLAVQPETLSFNHDVRPILSRACFACHGPDSEDRQAGLRLDVRESALQELDSGMRAIVPGKPTESELVARILDSDPDVIMPPPESNHVLTKKQKEILSAWIAGGAEYQPHWAYVPPERHTTPKIVDDEWSLNWIDHFILDRLTEKDISPTTDADPITLVRRVIFDLTGLPPTPSEIDSYLANESADRYEQLVDRLLASPRHAERLASWWLDLVRYADTVGYHGDQTHSASPYRDWVIAAFQKNLRFDRFTEMQLASDFIKSSPDEHPEDLLLAGAYNRLLQTTHEGGLQVKEYRAIYQADRIRNLSGVWLGATVGCAQCHDHKYDPYTSRDFYALGAFFADVDDETHMGVAGRGGGTNTLPTARDPEQAVVGPFDRAQAVELDRKIDRLRKSLPPLPEKKQSEQEQQEDKQPEAEKKGEKSEAKAGKKKKKETTQGAEENPVSKVTEPPEIVQARKHLKALESKRNNLERKLMITKQLAEPRVVRIKHRGNWMDESGEIVEPAIPSFLGSLQTEGRATREDLAHWLVAPISDGGVGELTARVTANRIWSIFFGAGLCRSADDFGGQGEPPDYPKLLDRLALEFFDSGWDVRHLIRCIVTSHAYRMSSDATDKDIIRDPENRLLARQGRWRYHAEGVRDAALSISGLLEEKLGGASVHPYQPAGYYRHLNFPKRTYSQDNDQRQWRRGLYVHWQRMFLHPQLAAFDAPTREECTAVRMRSNTPKAALVLLNDPTFIESARNLAERVIHETNEDEERLALLWRHAVSRQPDVEERSLLANLLTQRRDEFQKNPKAAEDLLTVGISPRDNSLDVIEHAAWTATARAVLNLRETVGRY
ncbi:MAG: PSD1 and planctomycete cytochrome C domain-containing protein [Planctomycetota bacterium]|nr:PSD1 and planctomycete cytochrome C domain-containing protein [Planctomycetota bacterium]